jgi:uncharacterized SAM-binding protein YcdF (DUF218 family)
MLSALVPILRRVFRFLAAAVTLLVLIVHFTPLVPWYAQRLAGSWTEPDGDILIVLANDMQPDDLIGSGSYWRAIYAIRIYHQRHFRAVVISGGPGGGHLSMAQVIGRFLVSSGVPADVIHLEEQSTSTRENAIFTTSMVSSWPGKKVLLTSDSHMFRARRAFAAAGLQVTPCPIPDVLKASNGIIARWPCFWGLALETIKIVYYFLQGWI